MDVATGGLLYLSKVAGNLNFDEQHDRFARIVTLRLVLKSWNIATNLFPSRTRRTSDPTYEERSVVHACVIARGTGKPVGDVSCFSVEVNIYVVESVEPFGSSRVHKKLTVEREQHLGTLTLMPTNYILTAGSTIPAHSPNPTSPPSSPPAHPFNVTVS